MGASKAWIGAAAAVFVLGTAAAQGTPPATAKKPAVAAKAKDNAPAKKKQAKAPVKKPAATAKAPPRKPAVVVKREAERPKAPPVVAWTPPPLGPERFYPNGIPPLHPAFLYPLPNQQQARTEPVRSMPRGLGLGGQPEMMP